MKSLGEVTEDILVDSAHQFTSSQGGDSFNGPPVYRIRYFTRIPDGALSIAMPTYLSSRLTNQLRACDEISCCIGRIFKKGPPEEILDRSRWMLQKAVVHGFHQEIVN